MAQSALLLDSNILIRWVQQKDPNYPVIQSALNLLVAAEVGLHYTSQNLGEFWNTMTRPADRNGYGFSPREADELARLIEIEFLLLPDNVEIHREWRRMLVEYGISGVQVHDARLVASMRVHGVNRILTLNTRDFARFTDVTAVRPAEITTGRVP
jgi:predicted nucleic acid-binding protein